MTTNPDTSSQDTGLSLAGAAAQFEALLNAKDDNPAQSDRPGTAAPEPSKEEDDALDAAALADDEALPADDAPETGAEGESDDSEEGAAPGDEDAPEADPMEQVFSVKIDGKEEPVTLKEALAGYQRHADYTRKTIALAQERNAIQAEKQEVQAARQQYADLLGALGEELKNLAPAEPDWDRLYNENPLEYVRQKDLHRELRERRAMLAQEQARVQAQAEAERAAEMQQYIASNREKLLEAIPAWQDKTRWEADRARLREYAQKVGFSQEELDQAYDHRAVVALYKAMRYDELVARKPRPDQARPTGAPKAVRPGAPNAFAPRKTSDITRAKQRLAKTGNVSDAAKIFESLL